jgi:RNA polymerase sigma factor (sigma-70 family)
MMPSDGYLGQGSASGTVRPALPWRFEDWYRDESPGLILFAVRLGADICHAHDLAQDACARVLERWETICSPRAYVRVVIRNAYFKHRQHDREDLVLDLVPATAVEDPGLGEIEFQDQEEMIFAAIRLLPPRQREVIAWTIDGYGPSEIARILGCEALTIRGNLHKARQALKRSLSSLRGGSSHV